MITLSASYIPDTQITQEKSEEAFDERASKQYSDDGCKNDTHSLSLSLSLL